MLALKTSFENLKNKRGSIRSLNQNYRRLSTNRCNNEVLKEGKKGDTVISQNKVQNSREMRL